jgi:hypothetical protein
MKFILPPARKLNGEPFSVADIFGCEERRRSDRSITQAKIRDGIAGGRKIFFQQVRMKK